MNLLIWFFRFRFICITFISLAIWATVYEQTLLNVHDNDNLSHSRQSIHPVHKPTSMPAMTKSNTQQQQQQQRIYSYENRTIDLECSEPALKKDKNHTNNIMNGCTFELHPIPIDNNNGNHQHHLTNNNKRNFYRLNNNNQRNGITITNNSHNTGINCNNNDDGNDNMKMVQQQSPQNGSSYATKTLDDVQTYKHDLSKLNVLLFFLLSVYPLSFLHFFSHIFD